MTAGTGEIPDQALAQLNGPVIRFAMRIRRWSQAGFAAKIGISESTMSRALRGEPTTYRVVRSIVEAFDGALRVEEVANLPGISPELPTGALDLPAPT